MTAYEGQHNPKLISFTISQPVSIFGPVTIPGLPQGFSLPWTVIGRAADNFFSVTNTADMVSLAVGAEGNASHVISSDESGQLACVVKGGSASLTVLSVLYRAQRLIGSGQLPPFTFKVDIRDNNSQPPTTHSGFNCLILRQPDDTFGAGERELTWGFVAAQVISNFNGRVAPG